MVHEVPDHTLSRAFHTRYFVVLGAHYSFYDQTLQFSMGKPTLDIPHDNPASDAHRKENDEAKSAHGQDMKLYHQRVKHMVANIKQSVVATWNDLRPQGHTEGQHGLTLTG